ncbi:integral membrane protein MviN [Crinalium epipsammum PCC 9333]|uniref:Probable lipid II flippase MurJ n=1 Tax=Crinalium epipsammum PCC 9333 TaxID=1173022 RepID=K9W1U8_9CYAN|nr:murein biosynthesis integral membrane protein MurJ [Crinalium epipsammum]AFZ13717.1 integral membrane protein MviN [Crinalium epipsammum PCC 9333]
MSEKPKPARTLAGIAGIVAVATLISKVFGLVRQQAIAAAFGVGVTVDAYNYAYVIPGFLLILLGGINGPFHSAIVSVLAKRDKSEAAPLVETVTTMVGGILLFVSIGLIVFAGVFIDIVAPGLSQTDQGLQIRAIAIQQLQIMAPMALLAGLIGIGFGTLNSADMYWLPSVSPIFSSLTVIGGLAFLAVQLGNQINAPQYALLGGQFLAWGSLLGAILQWVIQVIAQWRAGLGTLRLRFEWWRPGVKDVLKVMGPATLSSGMLQINLYTDLYFASYIPQAAAAMNYSGLLIQTPLGIISNVILVPLLPIFSRLADPIHWPELKTRIRQGILVTAITMLPLSALMVTLAFPIVRVVYERYAFDKSASEFVASVLIASSLGMFVYLGRDVLVRVFYALGDGETPFRISVVNIVLNAVLDYLLVKPLGAPGLVLATVGVNLFSMVALSWFLNRKLHGLPWRELTLPIIAITGSSFIAGLVSWGVNRGFEQIWRSDNLLVLLLQLGISALAGLSVFALCASRLNLPEVDMFVSRLKQRFLKSDK